MASTVFSFGDTEADSGSDHEHWPEDFKSTTTAAVASPGYDTHNGLRMHSYEPTIPVAKEVSPPPAPSPAPPSPEKSVYSMHVPLTEFPAQFVYMPPTVAPTATVAPAPAPKAKSVSNAPTAAAKPVKEVSNTYTYHPTFTEKPAVETNKWQGRTKAEVEEDNQKIAIDENAWEKRTVVPTGLADDQMCWVVEADATYTLRTFAAVKDLAGDWKKDPRYEDSWYFVV